MEELAKLISDYKLKNPTAVNPMDYMAYFSIKRMITLLKKANNRLITFKKESGIDNLSYTISK